MPCAASARAKAAPIPEEAPVIKAVFPAYGVVAVPIGHLSVLHNLTDSKAKVYAHEPGYSLSLKIIITTRMRTISTPSTIPTAVPRIQHSR
jgi:hypothetical protein